MLTKKQKEIIENAAKQRGTVRLYRETSMSGKSETLRWERRFVEHGRFGPVPRTRTGMILSVVIEVMPDGKDDPVSLQKYQEKCAEAEAYFQSLRN